MMGLRFWLAPASWMWATGVATLGCRPNDQVNDLFIVESATPMCHGSLGKRGSGGWHQNQNKVGGLRAATPPGRCGGGLGEAAIKRGAWWAAIPQGSTISADSCHPIHLIALSIHNMTVADKWVGVLEVAMTPLSYRTVRSLRIGVEPR